MEFLQTNQNLLIFLIAIWTLPWKGYALWKAARNSQRNWFIVLLVVNTLAILEIVYLKFFQKRKMEASENDTRISK